MRMRMTVMMVMKNKNDLNVINPTEYTNMNNGIMIFARMTPLPDLVHHLLAHVDALVLVDPPPDVDLTRTHGTRTHTTRAGAHASTRRNRSS